MKKFSLLTVTILSLFTLTACRQSSATGSVEEPITESSSSVEPSTTEPSTEEVTEEEAIEEDFDPDFYIKKYRK